MSSVRHASLAVSVRLAYEQMYTVPRHDELVKCCHLGAGPKLVECLKAVIVLLFFPPLSSPSVGERTAKVFKVQVKFCRLQVCVGQNKHDLAVIDLARK